MGPKSTPVSIRITPRDAEFLASLDIDEAVTPSEKIRAIIREAREQREGSGDPSGGVGMGRRIVESVLMQIKEAELKQEMHSELLSNFGEWILDLLAYLGSLVGSGDFDLKDVERGIGERILRLATTVSRMGITPTAPCYDAGVIRELIPDLLQVASIVDDLRAKENER